MNNEEDNIFVISKEQAMDLLSKNNFNQENMNSVRFSLVLLVSLIIFILALVTPVLLLVLTPVFLIEYLIKKFFEKRENITDENGNSSS